MSTSDRVGRIATLRFVADLCERVPELPVPSPGSGVVSARTDAEGRAEIERMANALRSLGVPAVVYEDPNHGIKVVFGDYYALYIFREAMAKHYALSSYSDAVKPDLEDVA